MKPWLYISCALLCLAPLARAQAQSDCHGGPAVDLTIELEPPDAAVRQGLERQLAAELRARNIEVCPVVPGRPMVAHVRLRASLPELSPALVRIRTDAATSVDRSLDVATLPREARPSALASATDELLASLLAVPPAQPNPPLDSIRDAPPAKPVASTPGVSPLVAFGLGAGVATFSGDSHAVGADLRLRFWPLLRGSLTARVGVGATSYPTIQGVALSSTEWLVGVEGGLELLEPEHAFGLSTQAGVRLARRSVEQEAQLLPRDESGLIGFLPSSARPLDPTTVRTTASSWEFLGSLELEARYRVGAWGVSAGLAALLSPAQNFARELFGGPVSEQPGRGARLGLEMNLGVWFTLDRPRR